MFVPVFRSNGTDLGNPAVQMAVLGPIECAHDAATLERACHCFFCDGRFHFGYATRGRGAKFAYLPSGYYPVSKTTIKWHIGMYKLSRRHAVRVLTAAAHRLQGQAQASRVGGRGHLPVSEGKWKIDK